MNTLPNLAFVRSAPSRPIRHILPPAGFDGLVSLALQLTQAPVTLLSLERGERVVLKSRTCFNASEIPRAEIFCAPVRIAKKFLMVPDALADARFAKNPLVTMEQPLRFFAGAPVADAEGRILGVLAVLDYVPRELNTEQQSALKELAAQVVTRLELDRLARETTRQAAELRAMNETIEQRVRERTTVLQAANKELEAFAHSAAHDLRAPLRAIEGLPALLLERHGSALPVEAQRHLRMLCESALKMNRLVEDLLAFSQHHLQPVRKQPVSLSGFVSALVEESRREHPERKLVFRLNKLCDCEADPVLLKQVFVNLIANAIKFTAPRAVGVIEIGCRELKGRTVYYVRDNGVGFDMRYAHRLFDVFQRLHRADEFEGTGIGLSIVRRIIQRHGGSIWAQSEPGKGATFYFSLPETNGTRAEKTDVPMAGAEETWGRTVVEVLPSLRVGYC